LRTFWLETRLLRAGARGRAGDEFGTPSEKPVDKVKVSVD